MTDAETRWKKKPVVIDAFQFVVPLDRVMPVWLREAMGSRIRFHGSGLPCLTIQTLEGEMKAIPGDWIIKGIKGELYPCKPDIFAATYEPADTPAAPPALPEGYEVKTSPDWVHVIAREGGVATARVSMTSDGLVRLFSWSYPRSLTDLAQIVDYLQRRAANPDQEGA